MSDNTTAQVDIEHIGEWFAKHRWEWFATVAFDRPRTIESANVCMRAFVHQLGGYVFAYVGCEPGDGEHRTHGHLLIGGTVGMPKSIIQRQWHQGEALFEPYTAAVAEQYAAKLIDIGESGGIIGRLRLTSDARNPEMSTAPHARRGSPRAYDVGRER